MKEIWKDILNYEGYYQISNYGRVKSLKRSYYTGGKWEERIYKVRLTNNGYEYARLSKNNKRKNYPIHRLVAIHFIVNPKNKPEINHIDGVKNNNYVNNLEWCTSSENKRHAFKIGLNNNKGEKHFASKLTQNEVDTIRQKLSNGVRGIDLSNEYNVAQSAISKIKHYKLWKNTI